jgi:hypothetical protein
MQGQLQVLTTIRNAWRWTGLDPSRIEAVNPFGNVIVRAVDGAFWRICPEALSCEVVARSAGEYAALWADGDFQVDWQMERLVHLARSKFGPPADGRCYCLKVPALLGGAYDADNLGVIDLEELIAFVGDIAEQIKDLPDGTQVTINLTD